MEAFSTRFGAVRFQLVERAFGGWLAVSVPGSTLRIATEGKSRDEAEHSFLAAVEKWTSILDEHARTQK